MAGPEQVNARKNDTRSAGRSRGRRPDSAIRRGDLRRPRESRGGGPPTTGAGWSKSLSFAIMLHIGSGAALLGFAPPDDEVTRPARPTANPRTMLLRTALPRFYAEATAAIAAMPDDEIPDGTTCGALLAQFEALRIVSSDASGSFRVDTPQRSKPRGYAFSMSFDIPSGNVIADLDLDLRIFGFEPICASAMADIRAQLDSARETDAG